MKPILAWHFVGGNRELRFPHNGRKGVKIRRGLQLHVKPPLAMCERGLHGSIKPLDALRYYIALWGFEHPVIVCRVELSGQIQKDTDKLCAEYRKVLWWHDCTKTLHEFACWCAEQALALIEAPDPRSVAAIEAKHKWLRGEIDAGVLAAAGAAEGAAQNKQLAKMFNKLNKQ